MSEDVLYVWLIGITIMAFAALRDNAKRPYDTGRYFAWLGAISVVVFLPLLFIGA